jgi:hypothetical protein
MPQTKDIRVQSYLEPTIYKEVEQECTRLEMTESRFVRMVLMRYFKEKGTLDNAAIAAMTIGVD